MSQVSSHSHLGGAVEPGSNSPRPLANVSLEKTREGSLTQDSVKATAINDGISLATLPEPLIASICEELLDLDPAAIVKLACTSSGMKARQSVKSAMLTMSLIEHMTKTMLVIRKNPDHVFALDRNFVKKSLDQLSSLDGNFKRRPIVKFIHLTKYDEGEFGTSLYLRMLAETNAFNNHNKSEMLQPLIETLPFRNPIIQGALFKKLLNFVIHNNVARKDALYSSLGHVLLSMPPSRAQDVYTVMKNEILDLKKGREYPLAHLVRTLHLLNNEKAETELREYLKLVDTKNNPQSIYILNGILRSKRAYTSFSDLELLDYADKAMEHISGEVPTYSHMRARSFYIAGISKELQPRALQRCIKYAGSLTAPETCNDQTFWKRYIYTPLISATKSMDIEANAKIIYMLSRHIDYPRPTKFIKNFSDLAFDISPDMKASIAAIHPLLQDHYVQWETEAGSLGFLGE